MSRVWWILVLVLVSIPVYASTIENAETTITAYDEEVIVELAYELRSEVVEDVVLNLPKDVTSLVVKMGEFRRDCTLEDQGDETLARCGSTRKGVNKLLVSYKTRQLIGKLGEQTIIKYGDKLPFKTEEYNLTIKLPEGFVIPKEDNQDFYINPEPTKITSDGRRIILQWKTSDVTRFSANVISQSLQKKENNNSWFMALVVFAITSGFLISVLFVLRIRKQIVEETSEKTKENKIENVKEETEIAEPTEIKIEENEEILPSFIESEKKVVELLKNSEKKELWQKEIQKNCDFSKAKLSRIIRNLESRGVVEKEAYGNTNKIILKQKNNGTSEEE